MLFHTQEFLIFLVVLGFLYYLPLLSRLQVPLIVLGSFVFYSWEKPEYLLLLAGSCVWSSLCSRRCISSGSRVWLWLGVGGNLGLLCFCKYAVLLWPSRFTLYQNVSDNWGLIYLPLPVGISFFTFQGISLVVDRFRRSGKGLREFSFLQDVAYLTFFPQLVAGPIVRATEFLPQIKPKTVKDIAWADCYRFLVLGYFLKRVVADNLNPLTRTMTQQVTLELSSIDLLALIYAYGIQIFSDFAGYSLIAMGLAGLFGYRLPINFRSPYLATSFSDFWRRWHVTLSTWLRDYLYIPLGGNRKGKVRTYINLMVVMALGGVWHGASWNFLVWGLAHGLFLALERPFLGTSDSRLYRLCRWLLVYFCVNAAWLLFIFETPEACSRYVQAIFLNYSIAPTLGDLFLIIYFSLPVWLYHLLSQTPNLKARLAPYIYGLLLFLVFTEPGAQHAFIYFQF